MPLLCVTGARDGCIRTALYDADYSCTVANRASDAAPVRALRYLTVGGPLFWDLWAQFAKRPCVHYIE